jgi:AsmA protein
LVLEDVSLDKPIQCDFSAKMNEQPIGLNGIIGPVGKDPGRASIPIDIDLNAGEALKMTIAGKIMNAVENVQAELKIEVKPFSLKKILERLGTKSEIQTADSTALRKISLKADVKAGQTAVSISQGKLTIDDTHMVFSITASQFDRPNIKFDFDLDQIDVNRYLPPEAKPEGETPQTSSKQEKPASSESAREAIDYTPLRRLALDGRFAAEKIVVKKTTITDSVVAIKAKEGLFHIDPLRLKAHQGTISGNATFNVKGDKPSSDLYMNVSNLQIAPLVQAYAGKEMIEGVTNATMKINLEGDDPARIKQRLNGSGELRIGDGAVVGIDLAAMARNVKTAFGGAQPSGDRPRTDFTELRMPFTIRNGVVDTRQTSMKSPFLRVLAAGEADLNKETLNFRIEPKAVGTIKGQGDEGDRSGIMVPVLVSGTFAKPTFRPDLKAIAEQQLEKQVFENEKVKEVFEKEELKPYKEPVKDLLKGIIK